MKRWIFNASGNRAVAGIVFGASTIFVALFFLVLKMYSMHPYAGDEHIYTYQAKMIAEGVAPYSGFAMAHPPFHAIFTAGVIQLFGTDFHLIRTLPMLWCLLGGVLLAWMVRRELGTIAAIAGMGLYLLAYEPLRSSSHSTGVNMTVALLIGATLAYRYRAIRITALILVAAVFTRLYAAPGVLVLTIIAAIADRKTGLRLVLWGALFGSIAFLAVGAWSGFGDMLHNMVLYHAQKTPMAPETLANMKRSVLFHNAAVGFLFALSQLAVFYELAREYAKQNRANGFFQKTSSGVKNAKLSLVLLSSAIAVFFLLVLINVDRVWMYYFIPSFPFAAIGAGWLVSRWLHGAKDWLVHRNDKTHLASRVGGLGLFVLFLVGCFQIPGLESNLAYWDKEMKKTKAQRTRTYKWHPGWVPDPVNRFVKSTLWNEKRVIGEPYTRFNYYLWHESRVFDVADDLVEFIENETTSFGRLFGDSGTVPLLALLSKRAIAGNEIDTNLQRYRSGNADPVELIKRIDRPTTEMVILRRNFGVFGVKEVRRLVREKYQYRKRFVSAQNRVFLVFTRKNDKSDTKKTFRGDRG